jgi:hypothetical protein
LALNSEIQTNQILENDDEVFIPHLSFILLAVHTFIPKWAYFHPVVEGPVSRFFSFFSTYLCMMKNLEEKKEGEFKFH